MGSELRTWRWWTLAYFVLLEALLAAAILFWPKFESNLETLRGMAPLQVLRDMTDMIDRAGVSAYVNGQHFFKGCNLLGCVVATLFTVGAVAGEAQRGTLEIWLARPLSRRRILSERFVAGALALVVPVFLTTLTIPWLLGYVGEELELGRLLLCAAHQALFLLAVYAASFLFSCLSARPMTVLFTVLGIVGTEFSLYMIQVVTHASLFRLSDMEVYGRIYASGRLEARLVLPLLAWSAGCYALSLLAFARRTP
jgi:ABC-2 type transport system permease protein